MKKTIVAAALLVFSIPVLAQTPVKQSGASVTPNQVPWWVTSGVIGGGVSSADSPVSSFGVTNNGGNGICSNSDRITTAGRNTVCIGTTTNGSSFISSQNYGTATAQPLCLNVNGSSVCIGGTTGGSLVTTTLPSTNNTVPCWVNTVGTLGPCNFGAATLFGNPSGLSAAPAPFTIPSLTARGAPDANNDKIPIYDAASGTIKYVTPGLIASSATAGVSSLGAVTGAITLASELSMSGQQLKLTIPPRGASVNLNNVIEAWIPPNPNLYHLFIANAVKYNQGSLFASVSATGAAFVPPNGTHLINLVAQTWFTSGVTASGNMVTKWIKNATVDVNNNLTIGSGVDVCAGIGNPSDFGSGTAIVRADCYDQPSNGDYYNLFMFIDSTALGAATVVLDGNPAHTYVQATVIY